MRDECMCGRCMGEGPPEPDYPPFDFLEDIRDDLGSKLSRAIDADGASLPYSMAHARQWAKEATDLVYERFLEACDRHAESAR